MLLRYCSITIVHPILLFLRLKEALKFFQSCSSTPCIWCTCIAGCCAAAVLGVAGQLPWRANLLLRHMCSYSSLSWLARLDICKQKTCMKQYSMLGCWIKGCGMMQVVAAVVAYTADKKPGGWDAWGLLRRI
jgi:hypothetical protein